MENIKRILVTGATGFIGSHFCRYLLKSKKDIMVVGFARGKSGERSKKRIEDLLENEHFDFIQGDLTKTNDIAGLLERIDCVVNFAAFTYVDHSIKEPNPFIDSNIVGTFNLLEQARKYKPKIFIQISTDEVYGPIFIGSYKENAPLNPSNPYAATKAAGDMLALSYFTTYGLPIIITRTENNYGEWQHPQKALPTFIRCSLNGEKLPIYGDGKHKRMWLYVEDHCRAIDFILDKGKVGEIYHIAGEIALENQQLAKMILQILGKPESQIKYIDDFNIRPGHDRRYALDVSKLKSLGWETKYNLQDGLEKTIAWYLKNQWWLM